MQVNPNDPTLAEAMAALESREKDLQEAPELPEMPTEDSASTPQTAPAESETEQGTPPEPKPGDTPGAPSTTEPKSSDKPAAKTAAKPDGKAKSDYAKSEERKNIVWSQVKADKAALHAEQDKFKAEKESFQRERLAFEKKQADATKSTRSTPEQFEAKAADYERDAQAAYDKGELEAADEYRALAKLSRRYAAQLRANPPKPDPTAEQVQQAFGEEQKKWLGKAGIDFPDIAKKGPNGEDSPAMAKYKAMTTPGSEGYDALIHEAVRNSPQGAYYAAERAHLMTVAARVPTLEKELADSRAEVKRLNGKLSVNGDGLPNGKTAPRDFRSLSPEEQEAQLRQEAAGRKRW